MPCWIGCDVGGQSVKAVLVDERACVKARTRRPTGSATTIDTLAVSLQEIVGELRVGPDDVPTLGVGMAGVIAADGVLRGSPNLPDLVGRELARDLEREMGLPIALDNDANCAAYAEGWYGAARTEPNYLAITLGTGLGSGLVLDGDIYHGATGYACELGHAVVRAGGRRCGCGNRGCLEAYVSEAGARSIVTERSDALRAAIEARMESRGEGTMQALFAISVDSDGDEIARSQAVSLSGEMVELLGVGLATAVNILDIETIVIGGGIAPSYLSRLDELRRSMAGALFARSVDRIRVLAAVHGSDAGAIGAARLAMQAL